MTDVPRILRQEAAQLLAIADAVEERDRRLADFEAAPKLVDDAGEPWLDAYTAAKHLRLSYEGLRRKAMAGEVPAAKVGREWRFLRSDLNAWLKRASIREIA